MLRARLVLVVSALAVVVGLPVVPAWLSARPLELPATLTDREFWELSELVSEPNGEFQSDNFLSNERGYQVVIPELIKTAKPGRVYLGVGPEQNFPYILALKPSLAIIFDIRRGNLHEQLLYKALFEMTADRFPYLFRGRKLRIGAVHVIGLTTASQADPLDIYLTPSGGTPSDSADKISLEPDTSLGVLLYKRKTYQGQEKEPGEMWRLRIKADDLADPSSVLDDVIIVSQYRADVLSQPG
jgi:hypothetical protein